MKSNNIPSIMNTDHGVTDLFNQYFPSVFHDSSFFPNIDDLPSIHDSLRTITITVAEVFEALALVYVEKSPGMDKISPRVVWSCAEALYEPLHHLFFQSLHYATLPSS